MRVRDSGGVERGRDVAVKRSNYPRNAALVSYRARKVWREVHAAAQQLVAVVYLIKCGRGLAANDVEVSDAISVIIKLKTRLNHAGHGGKNHSL